MVTRGTMKFSTMHEFVCPIFPISTDLEVYGRLSLCLVSPLPALPGRAHNTDTTYKYNSPSSMPLRFLSPFEFYSECRRSKCSKMVEA